MAQISGMVLLRNRVTKIVGISCSTSAATGSVHPCQGRDRRLAAPRLQLHPQHPPLHKFLHGCEGAELESAMRADHHHTPVTIPGLLLEKAAGFGIKPQQKTRIWGHLRFQHHRW